MRVESGFHVLLSDFVNLLGGARIGEVHFVGADTDNGAWKEQSQV